MTNSFSFQKYAKEVFLARSLTLLFISLLFLNACSQTHTPSFTPITQETLPPAHQNIKKSDKVALLLPLSGEQSDLGQSLQKAAELSLFDHAGEALTLALYDTKGSLPGATKAAQEAIQEGAGLLIGPIFSKNVQSVAQMARRSGINVISFSNNKTIASSGVFAFGFSPDEQVRQIITYAASHGKKSFGVLIPRNAYGSLVEREVNQLRKHYPFTVDFIPYDINSNTLSHDLNPLKTLKIDALLIPEGGRALSRLISAILFQEIPLDDIQLLGTGQWDDPTLFENHTLSGAWIAAPNPQERFAFNKKYKAAYGEHPNRLATLAYDVISMLAVLRRHHGAQAFDIGALTQNRGFDGVDGLFRLRHNGMIDRKLSILKMTRQGLRPLQTSVSSF